MERGMGVGEVQVEVCRSCMLATDSFVATHAHTYKHTHSDKAAKKHV